MNNPNKKNQERKTNPNKKNQERKPRVSQTDFF